ncbi:MAG: DUF1249 domain-containing protein [Methylococcales bacterium]
MIRLDQKILRVALASPLSSLNPVNKSSILQTLCESNFHKLLLLAPDLLRIEYSATAKARGLPKLYIRIMDRKPYTLTMELTHRFESEDEGRIEPRVNIRVYLDAKSAEVLRDTTRPLAARILQKNPAPEVVLEYKWTINYFLERWLDHCIDQGYRFICSEAAEEISL